MNEKKVEQNFIYWIEKNYIKMKNKNKELMVLRPQYIKILLAFMKEKKNNFVSKRDGLPFFSLQKEKEITSSRRKWFWFVGVESSG